MKRRIIILSVLLLSLFVVTQPNSVVTLASGCLYMCQVEADICYQRCDEEFASHGNFGAWSQCSDGCFWQHETCTWTC